MNEFFKPASQWIAEHVPLSIGIAMAIFLVFFEVSKIKVYPLKWLWKAISWPFRKIDEQRTESFKAIAARIKTDIDAKLTEMQASSNANCDAVKGCFVNLDSKFADLESRFDALDEKQEETEERLDKLAAARIKNHVLNFARQCRKGEQHSHEDFSNLSKEVNEYSSLVDKYGWENDIFKNDWTYIQEVYRRGDFTE